MFITGPLNDSRKILQCRVEDSRPIPESIFAQTAATAFSPAESITQFITGKNSQKGLQMIRINQALLPLCNQALLPLCNQALLPLCNQALLPLCNQALLPLCNVLVDETIAPNWIRQKFPMPQILKCLDEKSKTADRVLMSLIRTWSNCFGPIISHCIPSAHIERAYKVC